MLGTRVIWLSDSCPSLVPQLLEWKTISQAISRTALMPALAASNTPRIPWGNYIATTAACCQSTNLVPEGTVLAMFQTVCIWTFCHHKPWWTLDDPETISSQARGEDLPWWSSTDLHLHKGWLWLVQVWSFMWGTVPWLVQTQSFICMKDRYWCRHPCHILFLAIEAWCSTHSESAWRHPPMLLLVLQH
jgi:hypothetical protein